MTDAASTTAVPPALTIGPDGVAPLPWLHEPLVQAVAHQHGHALLVHGAAGAGALEFAVVLAQSRLCERPAASTGLACGRCDSCRLFQGRLHPDLALLMPEVLRREHDWPLVGDRPDADDGKRKPSRQIRIDELRALIDWSAKTAARERGKAGVLHPADAMNHAAASALLKTLEEPVPSTRWVLTAGDPARLLPTVRSRCHVVRLPLPAPAVAVTWLRGQGVDGAEVLLAGAGGLPLLALQWAHEGLDAARWTALPQALAAERHGALAGWPVPRAIEAMHKVCHDALVLAVGGTPRFFPAAVLPARPRMAALLAWAAELRRLARHGEHPWHEGLLVETLVTSAAQALQPAPTGGGRARRALDTLDS